MFIPLLTTKFHVPQPRVDLIPRPHLIERLNDGVSGKLILVSAPAGFGKTTLVVDWIKTGLSKDFNGRVTWLSLDENDNDLQRFFTYFIAALQKVEPRFGEELRAAFTESQNPQIDMLLTLLINEIAVIGGPLILVLDDYHLISSLETNQALQFIIENQPPNLLLVITSRDEPFLPLSRLRARGQMVDVRAGDLRFSGKEVTQYLNAVMGLGLTKEDVQALQTRTEGWVTGLRLAALSMQEQDDPKNFIAEFTGDDRYIIDYLVDEVFTHRSQETRNFLLRTSILDRLMGSLCRAVTQQGDALEILQKLEQENVFIVPLDNRRQWYRYHHLFADVLRQRLTELASSKEIESLHHRASQWFDENGALIEAVEHAFKADEPEEVIRLIDVGAEELFLTSQLNILLTWHERLPHNLIDSHPKLCLIFAWAWVTTGRLDEAEYCLQAAEKAIGVSLDDLPAAPDNITIEDYACGTLLETAVVRAQLAIGRGDIPEALKLTGFALPYLEDDDCPYLYNPPKGSRMAACFIRGLAQKLLGDLVNATEAFIEAGAFAKKLNHVHIVALAYGHLANLQCIQGHLRQALETCERGLSEVAQIAGEKSPLSGFLRAEYGSLLFERNDLARAEEYFQEAVRVAKPWGFLDAFIPGLTGLAQIHVTRGDWQAAFETLNELAVLGQSNPQLVKPVVEAQRALLWSRRGDPNRAERWLGTKKLDLHSNLAYSCEEEHIILAEVLLAQGELKGAASLIDRLLSAAANGQREGRVIKLLALKAILFRKLGEKEQAKSYLRQAINLAVSEGYVRTFVDLGTPVEGLLKALGSSHPDYVRQLLAAFNLRSKSTLEPSMIDPLSERELDVLRMLATELTGPEIAEELVIAISTLRTHTQQIYRKLGVTNRRAALKTAKELHLL